MLKLQRIISPKTMWNTPTKNQLGKIPPLGGQTELNQKDVIIYAHFFIGSFDWWVAEYDGDDTFFGFANLGEPDMAEWGNISFRELKQLKSYTPMIKDGEEVGRLPIEVDFDKYWQPKRFSEVWPNI